MHDHGDVFTSAIVGVAYRESSEQLRVNRNDSILGGEP